LPIYLPIIKNNLIYCSNGCLAADGMGSVPVSIEQQASWLLISVQFFQLQCWHCQSLNLKTKWDINV
jgi:hypothetical protein